MSHVFLLTTATAIACAACGGDRGVSGESGEWLRDRALSVRMTSTDMGGSVEVRNDSDRPFPMTSFKLRFGDNEPLDLMPADAGEVSLAPGESFTFALTARDDIDEVHIEIGEGADREVFTLAMDGS